MISVDNFENGSGEIAVLCGNLKCIFSVKSYRYQHYKRRKHFPTVLFKLC